MNILETFPRLTIFFLNSENDGKYDVFQAETE